MSEDKKLKKLFTDPSGQISGPGLWSQMNQQAQQKYDSFTLRCSRCLEHRDNIFGGLCKDCEAKAEKLLRLKDKLKFVE